jgi:phosphoglycerol transferase MdoB-like AlkP superfamily enzyme
MIFALICVLAAGVLALAERSLKHIAFALAVQCLIVAVLALIVGDLDRAILLSALVTAAIAGASAVKYNHSGLKLVVTDLPLLFAGTVPFFIVQYPRAVASVALGAGAAVVVTVAINLYVVAPQVALALRILLLAVALVACVPTYRINGRATTFRKAAAEPRCFFSTFMASLVDALSWRQAGSFVLSDIANEPLPLLPAIPARTIRHPDIIIIQHESVFDPRLFGLPVEPTCEALLTPQDGLHGSLHVDIFGGGSWQSEFSVLTGLSSASFGPNAYFLFKKGAGRFHHSLPGSLAALGYKTLLTSSCRRSFLNYNDFYGSIGVSERMFTDDFAPPFDIKRFEATGSDGQFLQAAFDALAARIAGDPSPRFMYALTNFNHGPHGRRLASEQFERERTFAAASLPDVEYAEYYARLAETATTWHRLKSDLKAKFPDRPMLIVHYGDHQPVMVRRIEKQLRLPQDPWRQFRTFYAIETINMDSSQLVAGRSRNLDIAFLGTVALQQAGLPLDPIYATRASLLDECSEAYFASDSDAKRRFHRTLVELGLIDCHPSAAPLRSMILQR